MYFEMQKCGIGLKYSIRHSLIIINEMHCVLSVSGLSLLQSKLLFNNSSLIV